MAEETKHENMKERLIEEEMKTSYLDYSMSVIVGRALPDIKDGLKPVQRRILYAMYEMGLLHNKPYKKCARIVGEVLGKYHPHGDQAVYDALVRLAQDFSLRHPLIDGQGNFGSIDGDAPAAMRYTEARLRNEAEELLTDIDKNTVNFVQNFDASLKEPLVLPGKFPNLLVNGASGIAVGMATNIPPHNLSEAIDAIIATIDNPDITVEELMGYILGPDFPTGGIILGKAGLIQAYKTGKGLITVRGRAEIEPRGSDRERIVIKEVPYQVNKARLIEEIARNVREKRIKGITNIRDESDKEGIRIVIDVSSNTPANVVLNNLYKHTQLQTTFGINLLALVDNQPRLLNLKEMIVEFIKHRKNVVTKRTKFELREAMEREHILEGLIIALDDIDRVIKTIKSSKNAEEARKRLISGFDLSEKQAQAILDMKLQKLTNLEQEKIRKEQESLVNKIMELKDILEHEEKIYGIIKKELEEIKEKYGDERRTEVVKGRDRIEDLEDDRLIKQEDVVILISENDYIKRVPLDEYRQQRRGGKGMIGTRTKEGDIVKNVYVVNTHDYLMFFTNKGRVFWLKAYKIPETSRYSRGKHMANILMLQKDEKVKDIIPVKKFEKGFYIFFATKKGLVKKTELMEYSRPRNSGIIAIRLKEGDDLIEARLTDGNKEIILATKKGYAIRFSEADVRPMGRISSGVRGIRLRKGDEVVGTAEVVYGESLLTVTEKGFGKRTKFSLYRRQKRGGKGIKNMRITEKNGDIIGCESVNDENEVVLVSRNGLVIRTFAKDISEVGRVTQGVRVMRLDIDDKLVSLAKAG
ncbi:MAG: DNA gyrase subunit A [Candidatus Aenigmarchaeota archaeon]|nr:DNA gyrase subunit A [Candidatus Aenigmarchaeota archaeon]